MLDVDSRKENTFQVSDQQSVKSTHKYESAINTKPYNLLGVFSFRHLNDLPTILT